MINKPPAEEEVTSWLWVGLWTLVIFISIPLARAIQVLVADSVGGEAFLVVVFSALAFGVFMAVRAGLRSGVHRSPVRLFCLLVIGGLFAVMSWGLRANPEEAMHFVQYGVLSVFLFRALVHRVRDWTLFVSAAMIGAVIGCADEIFQWLIPRRFFDFKDLLMNAVAGILVQMVIGIVLRPSYVIEPMTRFSVRLAGGSTLAFLAILVLCLCNTPGIMQWYGRWIPAAKNVDEAMVEYGYRIDDPEIGTFFTRIHPSELKSLDSIRGKEAAGILDQYRSERLYPEFLHRYPSYKDAYLHEARVHLFRRDRHLVLALRNLDDREASLRSGLIAYREDQIMRLWFPELYRHSSFAWEERVRAPLRGAVDLEEPYVSKVSSGLFTPRRGGISISVLLGLMAAAMLLMRSGLGRVTAREAGHA